MADPIKTPDAVDESELTPDSQPVQPEEKEEQLNEGGLNALKKERAERKKLEKRLREMSSVLDGVDPEEVKTLLAEKKRQEEAEITWEQQREKLLNDHRSQVEIRDQKIQELSGLLVEKELFHNFTGIYQDVGGKFASEGDKFAYCRMLFSQIKDKLSLEEDGSIFILDGEGDILYRNNKPVTLRDYLSEDTQKQFGIFFDAPNPTTGIPYGKNRRSDPREKALNGLHGSQLLAAARGLGK